MEKKIIALAIVTIFIFSAVGAYAASADSQPTAAPMEKTKERLNRGMNNLLYGPTEVPQNIDETKTKGAKMDRCITKTQDGVERGIARFVTGIWQLATFWYSDPECATSAKK